MVRPDLHPDIDPERFPRQWFDGRGFRQAFVRAGAGGVPLLLVHGWPESKRIWWKVIEPLATAGFDKMAAAVFPDHVGPFRLPDCGHFVPWEAPDALVSAVVALCGDLLAAGAAPR